MKKFMCLMLALSIVMMTMVFVPMSASAVSSLPVSDDFNSGTTIDNTKWDKVTNRDQSPGATIIGGASYKADGNVLKMDGNDYANFGIKTTSCAPTAFQVEFDVYVPESYNNSELKLKGGNNNEFLYIKKNEIICISVDGTNKRMSTNTETWYNVVFTMDTTSCAMTTTVTPAGGTATTISGKYTGTLNEANEIYFQAFYMNKNSTFALLDNVSIDKYVPPVEIWSVSSNFNDDSAVDTTKWNKYTLEYPAGTTIVSLEDGTALNGDGNVIKINGTYGRIGVKPATPPTSFRVKYDLYMPSGFGAEVQLKGGLNEVFLWLRDSRLYYSTGNIGTPLEGNTWYTVECAVDITGKSSTTIVTPKAGGASVSFSGTLTSGNTANEIYFQENNNGNGEHPIYIDNLTIEETIGVPKSNGVTFVKYDDTTSTALENVSAGTKEIVVGFSADVDNSTLNDDTVTLVNKTTNTTVDYTGEYNATEKTWTIPVANYLDPSAAYELTVTSAVQNGDGESAPLYRYAFTTDAGEYKVTSIVAYNGNEVVDEWADITEDTTITVKANVINTTGVDNTLLLICAGYNGDEVKACAVSNTKAVTKDQKNIIVEDITLTVDKDDMTTVKLFGWDNTLDYLTTGVNVID